MGWGGVGGRVLFCPIAWHCRLVEASQSLHLYGIHLLFLHLDRLFVCFYISVFPWEKYLLFSS